MRVCVCGSVCMLENIENIHGSPRQICLLLNAKQRAAVSQMQNKQVGDLWLKRLCACVNCFIFV